MKKKEIIIFLIMIVLILIACGIFLWYNMQLKPVDSQNIKTSVIEVESGMSTEKILKLLNKEGLIKNTLAAKIYIRLNNVKGLQAGKYTLSSDMSLEKMLNLISSGEVVDEKISITFLEGKNMRWIAKEIAKNTSNTEEDVFNLLEDKDYINSLISDYWFLTDEITNKDIYYPLEGYLYPDTYKFKNKDITVKEIFKVLLDQEEKVLNEHKKEIEKSGGSVHQILTLASIIELEGKGEEARKGIASVIYNRLKKKMSIGSDVTTYYAIKVDMAERNLYTKEINTYNPYNTRGPNMAGKLPIGPIATVSASSIEAALNPIESDYLYFVSDSSGKIYFAKSYEEHQKNIRDLKQKGLWYEY